MSGVWRDGPGPLEDVEALDTPERRRKEAFTAYLSRLALKLGHRKALPEEVGVYTERARLARRVLTTPGVRERIDAIFRGEFDTREPGQDG
jgi:hypothetical protein